MSQVTRPTINEPWYWRDLNRVDAENQLRLEPDGTYLVRDSTSCPNAFVLFVRCAGQTKKVQIFCDAAGHCGFWPDGPFRFSSLRSLIENYSHESLQRHSPELNVCLERPFVRQLTAAIDDASLMAMLNRCLIDIEKLQNEIASLEDEHRAREQELVTKKQGLQGFDMILRWFEQQRALARSKLNRLTESDQPLMEANMNRIADKMQQVEVGRQNLAEEIEQLKNKPSELYISISDKRQRLRETELKEHEVRSRLDAAGVNVTDIGVSRCCHNITENWLFGALSREEAEAMLLGKPAGTFLIRARPGAPSQPYALTIVYANRTHGRLDFANCLINYINDSYGFAAPFIIYRSLIDLVLHYKDNSLREHNDDLDVRLEKPVRTIFPGVP